MPKQKGSVPKMKCILCNQRKGKRHCPAKDALICAQCCGEKRILEIDCPESCQYLRTGRSHEIVSENARHLKTSDPAKQQRQVRLLNRFQVQIGYLEYAIARERRASRDLTDRTVADALDLLLDTYRTEEKGVLYEHVSSNLRVDALRRQLREVVESLRNPKEPELARLRLREALDCLELLRDVLASHMEAKDSRSSYVDFLARTMPRDSEITQSRSPLILPG